MATAQARQCLTSPTPVLGLQGADRVLTSGRTESAVGSVSPAVIAQPRSLQPPGRSSLARASFCIFLRWTKNTTSAFLDLVWWQKNACQSICNPQRKLQTSCCCHYCCSSPSLHAGTGWSRRPLRVLRTDFATSILGRHVYNFTSSVCFSY